MAASGENENTSRKRIFSFLYSDKFYEFEKRSLDILLSLIGLIIALPLMIIFGAAIMLESKGSFIYCQKRVGRDGKVFTMYKLRSMYIDAEKMGEKWAQKDDPRITKIGRFIRKTRIDETPQIFNILLGNMSIVGPRPERPFFVEKFNREISGFEERLKVQCGLTGWAQINGGYDLTPEQKLKEDIYYINNRSILLDIKIILKTVVIVLTGKGAR